MDNWNEKSEEQLEKAIENRIESYHETLHFWILGVTGTGLGALLGHFIWP
jgi:hypothetical protein